MALSDKDILITPNIGSSTGDPKIVFKGADSNTGPSTITVTAYPTNNGTLSFDGSAGQLFSITNNLTSGSIYSVNDVSGIPSIDVDANGTIQLGPYGGNIGIGTTNPNNKLDVVGNAYVSGNFGVGTTNPAKKLHVQTGIVSAAPRGGGFTQVLFESNQATASYWEFQANASSTNDILFSKSSAAGSSYGIVGYDHAIDALRFYTNGQDRARINSAGNVLIGSATSTGTASQNLQVTGGAYVSGAFGIGTTNPSQSLDVFGNIRLGAQLTAAPTATPAYLSLGPSYSNGSTRSNCKIRLYENAGDVYGFSIGAAGDVQYHSTTTHQFYNSDVATLLVNGTAPYYKGNAIWHSGNDGAGSGLDADTLDGLNSSTTNTASTIVARDSAGNVIVNDITAYRTSATNTGVIYLSQSGTRYLYYDGTNYQMPGADLFVSGSKVWTGANDGAGSGLDADALDGLGSTSFLRSDTTTEWVGSAGGTFRVNLPAGALGSTASVVNTLQLYQSTINTDAFLSFHIGADYAAHFGIDGTTNDLFYGGWSLGSVKHKVWHAGNDGAGSGLDADLIDGLAQTSANTASSIVSRDASGNFSAGTITATTFSGALSGNSTTATTLQTARTINNVSFNGSANIIVPTIFDSNYYSIINPGGAQYVTQTSVVTGAIAITFPVGMTNSMMRMTIKVYEYTTNESFEIHCGGYAYNVGNTWANNPFAYIVGYPDTDRRFNVRFGYTAAGRAIIYIGELASTWSYPQVFVTEVQVGYSGASSTWSSGWAISFVSSAFENVTTTISDCQIGFRASTNTAKSLVYRDASGNFSAGTVSSSLLASVDQGIVNQNNGNGAAWYGRILSKNSTSDRASFLGTYQTIAGVFAHNNALNAWADLYVNTVDGATGGTVRMPTGVLINGSTAWHAGNDGAGSGLDADLLDGLGQTTANTGSTIVARDGSGNFAAGTITVAGPIVRSVSGTSGYLSGNYPTIENIGNPGVIYTIGGAYVPTATTLGNMYGIGYGYAGNAGIGNPGGVPSNTWGMYVASAGTARVFLDSDSGRGYFASFVVASNITSGGNVTGTATGIAGYSGTYWTSNNDGAGSGLDADLLDGISSASFLRSDVATTNTVSITSPRYLARASGISLGTGNSSQLEISNATSGACNISFHREGVYGAHFGLDTDNVFSTFGWSAGGGYTSMRVGSFTANGTISATSTITANSTFAVNNGWSYVANNYGYGIVGLYASTVFQLVFAMGDAYKTTAAGGINNLYGIAWSYPSAGGIAANLNTHGALITENGTYLAALSGSIRCRDDMRTPIYYDSDNTAYYTDPASTSNLNVCSGVTFNIAADTNNRFQQGTLVLRGTSPTLYLRDTDNNTAMIHCNSNILYVLRGANDSESWVQVNGVWPVQIDLTNNNATFGGTVTASSDIRFKKNIETIDNALHKTLNLRGVYFEKIETEGKHIGVIAQEVEKIIPEVVSEDSEGKKSVAYGNIVGLLIEAIKEQQTQIKEQQTQINELRNMIINMREHN